MRISAILVIAALAACNQPAPLPPARPVAERAKDDAAAVAALREGRFEDAVREATAVLARSPRDPEAAAVRAIATYQHAGSTLFEDIESVMKEADGLKAIDHERGRAAWQSFLDQLDKVDADLALAAAEPTFSLELCIACWEHDWNHNGRVDDRDRHLFEIEIDAKGEDLPEGDPRRRPTFRFDVGDADWARAMVSFQRAAVELVLAYKWSELDHLFSSEGGKLVIHMNDPKRVQRARELILAGVGFADRCRQEYLAETDDDREWVPNPRQKSHAVPLEVDGALYETWAATTGDVHRLLASEEGISLREVGGMVDRELGRMMPDAYIDVGRMLREPTDIVIDLGKGHDKESPQLYEHVMRGLLGHGYATSMKPSPLVRRLDRMKHDLEHGDDTVGRKLRYLFWLN